MNNPYAPPSSSLELAGAQKPSKRFWKVFFWINIVLMPLALIGVAISPSISWLDYIDVAMFLFILLGLYGYAFHRRLIRVELWKVVGIAYPMWFAPSAIGLYLYAFCSNTIWSESENVAAT